MGERNTQQRVNVKALVSVLLGVIFLYFCFTFYQSTVSNYWKIEANEVPTSLIFTFDKTDCEMYIVYSNLTETNLLMLDAPRYPKYYWAFPSEEISDFGIMRWANGEWLVLSVSTLAEGDYVFEKGYYVYGLQKVGNDTRYRFLVLEEVREADSFDYWISRQQRLIFLVIVAFVALSCCLILVPIISSTGIERYFAVSWRFVHTLAMVIPNCKTDLFLDK